MTSFSGWEKGAKIAGVFANPVDPGKRDVKTPSESDGIRFILTNGQIVDFDLISAWGRSAAFSSQTVSELENMIGETFPDTCDDRFVASGKSGFSEYRDHYFLDFGKFRAYWHSFGLLESYSWPRVSVFS